MVSKLGSFIFQLQFLSYLAFYFYIYLIFFVSPYLFNFTFIIFGYIFNLYTIIVLNYILLYIKRKLLDITTIYGKPDSLAINRR